MSTEPGNDPSPRVGWRIFPAVAIIAIGVLFLLDNLGYRLGFLEHGNGWAVLVLLAAFAPLARAWDIFHARGSFDADVAHHVLCGATVALVGVLFLLDLDWSIWWPLFVILGGLYTLAPRRCHRRDHPRHGGGDGATAGR
ncbi:MAG: hypothetical protein KJS83_07040 [Xanthomonadaceae bacterium]|nr:hypothetical protein [Xanthomonadaceae bacterium]